MVVLNVVMFFSYALFLWSKNWLDLFWFNYSVPFHPTSVFKKQWVCCPHYWWSKGWGHFCPLMTGGLTGSPPEVAPRSCRNKPVGGGRKDSECCWHPEGSQKSELAPGLQAPWCASLACTVLGSDCPTFSSAVSPTLQVAWLGLPKVWAKTPF